MHLLVLGTSHHTTSVDFRERVDFSRRGVPQALGALIAQVEVSEVVVLSTCNRSEIYVACEDPSRTHHSLVKFLSDFHSVPRDLLISHLYELTDIDAARHLFRVAAGLDSLVVGEPQILGQVKDAYSLASDQHLTAAVLNQLFHHSFAVGKRVRSETGLSDGAMSVSYASVLLARKIFGNLKDLSVLIIGAGEMAELTATHLRSQQVHRISVASRTDSHAEALVERIGGVKIPWTGLQAELVSADIIVTATGSASPLLTYSQIVEVIRARRNKPLFIIDIAVPRDVETEIGQIEQVFLYNIDDLRLVVSENITKRRAEVERAEIMVSEAVEKFMTWLGSRGAIPTVVALRQRFETIRRAELERLSLKLSPLSPTTRKQVDEITRLLVEKLLLAPTEQLKAISNPEAAEIHSDVMNRLFRLTEETPDCDTEDVVKDPESPTSNSKNSVIS